MIRRAVASYFNDRPAFQSNATINEFFANVGDVVIDTGIDSSVDAYGDADFVLTPEGVTGQLDFAKYRALTFQDSNSHLHQIDVLWLSDQTGNTYSGAIIPLDFNQVDALEGTRAELIDIMDYSDPAANLDTFPNTEQFNAGESETWFAGAGDDTFIYSGARASYSVERDSFGTLIVSNPNGTEDNLAGYEQVEFGDRSYNLTAGTLATKFDEGTINDVVDLYVAYFNRVPEASGLEFWLEEVLAGATRDELASRFYDAGAQFSDVTGYSKDMSLGEFVITLYDNVLDRNGSNSPDADEVNYWINQVRSGEVSREGLAAQFLEDARQFYGDAEVGYVPELLDNKVEFGKIHALTYGLDYNSQNEAIAETVALADAVTPDGYGQAIAMVGLGSDDYLA